MKNFEELIEEHGQWADETVPMGTSVGALLHAEREIKEIIEDIESGKPLEVKAKEYADAMFCLMDSARREGVAVSDILRAGDEKLQINKARKWKYNGDGSYSHIKTPTH